jgi:SnoaL-like domain
MKLVGIRGALTAMVAMTAMLFVNPIAGNSQTLATTNLSDEQKLVIAHACEDISIAYLTFIDTGDFKNMPNVFTEDGVWQVGGNTLVGHKAIREFWQRRVSLRKPEDGWRASISNQKIDVIDHDHARGTAYITVYKFNRTQANLSLAPYVFTQSNDDYVRTQQGWRLQLRQILTVAETIEAAQRSAINGKSTAK